MIAETHPAAAATAAAAPSTIWILEDHEVFARQIRRLISAEDDMVCPHHFASAADLFDKLRFTNERPDLLLLDLGLPRRDGLDVLSDIRKALPNVKVVILTSFDDRDKVYRAICNGAMGYLLKTSDPDEILNGIRDVIHGASALSSPIAKMILEGFSRYGPVERLEPLTSREEDVLRYLVKGLIKKEIADELSISQHTVDMHLRSVYRKLHVRSQTEAVSKALRQGLV
jgi:DNA-binding NarL/FixJ family response regulator